MTVEILEHTIPLSEMKPGQCAVSRDRKQLFACGYAHINGENHAVVFELNKLDNQYTDKRDKHIRVIPLRVGDKFYFEVNRRDDKV